jgi:uncharacterized membrane protein HdeD (DUF308 family)
MASPAPAPVPAESDGGGPVSARPAGLTIAAGAASVVVGALVLIWPDASIVVLAWLFGLQLVIAGILQLVAACWRDAGVAARVLLGLAGAFSILVGLLCLRAPLQTAVLLGLMVGAAWVVTGLLGIVLAFGAGHDRSRGWSIVSGILSTIGGAVVLLNPGVSIVVLTRGSSGSCWSRAACSSSCRDSHPVTPAIGPWPPSMLLSPDPPLRRRTEVRLDIG